VRVFLRFAVVALGLFCLAVLLFHDRRSVSQARSLNRLEIYYMYNEGESQSDWFAGEVEKFKKMHPGLEVDVLYAGREVLGKLRPRMIIGIPPDLVNQGGDALRQLMQHDLLEPLDDALASPGYATDKPWRDTFRPGIVDLYKYGDHLYQVPVSLFCNAFFYNIALFEELHLEPPRTWAEFLRVCQALKDNGIEPLAADGTEMGYNVSWFTQLASRTTSIERIYATASNQPGTSWTDKPFVDAARMVRELRDKGYLMRGYEGSKWPSAQMMWIQGKCGLLLNGTWIPKEMKNKLPQGFRMGIFRFPIVEGYPESDGLTQDLGAECFSIPKGSKHKERAIEFLKFITSKEENMAFADLDIPSAVEGPPMPTSLKGLDEMISPPHRVYEGMPGVPSELSEWYRIVARNLWSDLFLGNIGPEEMCRELDAASRRYYARVKTLGKTRNR